jgi:CheY-like chemotaxis protein
MQESYMPKHTILVVEDNPDILDSVRLLLELDGFSVIAVEDFAKALDYLAQDCPDLILTDLMTPEMTGLEFIHRVRRVSNFDPVPIIAMSAYDQTYLVAAVGAGAVTALHKPEDMDVLVQTVNQVLSAAVGVTNR